MGTDLEHTATAISDINQAIAELDHIINLKKAQLDKRDQGHQQKIDLLANASENAVSHIDNIINKLYRALEQNGTNHHNN